MADRVSALSKSTRKGKGTLSSPSLLPPQYDGPADDPTEEAASQHEVENEPSPWSAARNTGGDHAGALAESMHLPQPATAAGMLPSTTTAPAPASLSGDAARSGIFALPPPPSAPFATPPTPHVGPADTQSVASEYSPLTLARRSGMNPQASEFQFGAEAMLRRGPGVQPEARDPMVPPPEHDVGVPAATPDQAGRRRRAAVRHLAMAYRYLSAGDFDGIATRYDGIFEQDFGEAYTDERLRAIMHEPNDPPASEQPEEDENGGDEQ